MSLLPPQNGMEWRSEIKEVTKGLQELLLEIRQRPTRVEVEQMVSTKVSTEIFNAELKSIREDITALQGKPERLRAWTGTALAAGGCLFTVISVVVSTVISLIALWVR